MEQAAADTLPVEAVVVPVGQLVQLAEPFAAAKAPTAHGTQLSAPVPGYVPAGHIEHPEALNVPGFETVPAKPGAQLLQVAIVVLIM